MGVNSANSTYNLILITLHKERIRNNYPQISMCNPHQKKMKPDINFRIKMNPTKLFKKANAI